MKSVVPAFSGLNPRTSPRHLSDIAAQKAENCYLKRGRLAPSKAPLDIGTTLLPGTKTIFWYNREGNAGAGFWFQFDEETDVFRGPLADDPYLRTYYVLNGVMRFTSVSIATGGSGPYPSASYTVGFPVPDAIFATGPTGDPPDGGQRLATSYVVTFVSQFGEEGPPSLPSNIINRWDDGTVELTNIPIATGSFVVITKRIYRIDLQGVYQFVAEIPATQVIYSDASKTAELGESVPSVNWYAPPSDLDGLLALPNGIFMAWKKNTLLFSEPYQPHAWPLAYQLALDYDVVAAAVAGEGVVVTTTGKPYFIAGTSPDSMAQYKMDVVQSCVSKYSMVDLGDYVVYASPDGLVVAGNSEPRVITSEHITKEQWIETYNPSTIKAVRWGDRYLAFYTRLSDGQDASFTYNPKEGFLDFDQSCEDAFLDEQLGDIYLKQGTKLTKWFAGLDLSYTWKSKVFAVPASQIYTVCKVDAESYPVSLELFLDGVSVKNYSVEDIHPFRLPCFSRYRSCELEFTGVAIINNVQIATMSSEIT